MNNLQAPKLSHSLSASIDQDNTNRKTAGTCKYSKTIGEHIKTLPSLKQTYVLVYTLVSFLLMTSPY